MESRRSDASAALPPFGEIAQLVTDASTGRAAPTGASVPGWRRTRVFASVIPYSGPKVGAPARVAGATAARPPIRARLALAGPRTPALPPPRPGTASP